jgi:hypothetical protein
MSMNAALRFRLALALLLVAAVTAFNGLATDRALWEAQVFVASGALVASGIALVFARWVQRGDPGAPPRWRIEMLTVALAIPLVPILLSILPWLLVAFNDTPRSVEAKLISMEPVKGCGMKAWLQGGSGNALPADDEERALCLDGVAIDRGLHAGDPVRLSGRQSWAGFVIDRVERR